MGDTESDLAELRASFRDVLEDAASSGLIKRHVDSGALRCEALWERAAELGWFALLTPEAHGGLDLGRSAAAVLYQELGRVAAPLSIMGGLAATELLAAFGDAGQQEAWLPRLATGEGAAFPAAQLEPDWEALKYAHGAVSGDARDLLDGVGAALILLPARDGDEAWMLVDAKGASIEPVGLVDRTRSLAHARLKGAPAKALAGEARRIVRTLRTHASMALACDSIGGAHAVLDLTVAYLKTREQFGKPIGSFQALKHRCAEHKVAIEAADALVQDAVARWARGDAEAPLYAAIAKALACDVYAAVATDAVQLHGGIGFTWEHACHIYLKRAKLNQSLFGNPASHRDHAARLLLEASP
jgi:alkylation response protein AidB-like acyl-CoA dehydrogenase